MLHLCFVLCIKPYFLNYLGISSSKNSYSSSAVSHCFHLDIVHPNTDHCCSTKVDLLGCNTKLFTKTCNNHFHNSSGVFSRSNEHCKF